MRRIVEVERGERRATIEASRVGIGVVAKVGRNAMHVAAKGALSAGDVLIVRVGAKVEKVAHGAGCS